MPIIFWVVLTSVCQSVFCFRYNEILTNCFFIRYFVVGEDRFPWVLKQDSGAVVETLGIVVFKLEFRELVHVMKLV